MLHGCLKHTDRHEGSDQCQSSGAIMRLVLRTALALGPAVDFQVALTAIFRPQRIGNQPGTSSLSPWLVR